MDDCISRQAMLDGIDKLIKIHFDRTVVLYKARQVAENLPSAQPETNCSEIPNNSDTISRQAAIDALCKSECGWNNAECRHKDNTDFCVTCDNVKIINALPSAQPERKDAIEKAVAVEAISDELMSRFDISATYAYEIAEKAMNRIEAMAKEIGKR